jgi:hypothetical protein
MRDIGLSRILHFKTPTSREKHSGPESGKFPELEDELLEYVLGLCKDGCGVLHEMLHFKECKLATKRGISCTDLKVSQGWRTRFMKRKSLSLCQQTSLCQRMLKEFDDRVIDFLNHGDLIISK